MGELADARNIHWSKTIFNLTRYVADDQFGIGYTGMAYVDRAVKILGISVNDTGPYFSPTYENVATAEYPLARNVYLNVNKKPGEDLDPVLAELYKFLWSYEGQSIVQGQGIFLPFREVQVEQAKAVLAAQP